VHGRRNLDHTAAIIFRHYFAFANKLPTTNTVFEDSSGSLLIYRYPAGRAMMQA
jgi:hypothetical protein